MAAYVPTTWVDDSAPGISATELNRVEAGVAAALTMTEKWQELTIGSASSWVSVNLSAYGVAAGNVVEIMFRNTNWPGQHYAGVRAVGSALERRIQMIGQSNLTLRVTALGANATVELYVQSTTTIKAYLVGYVGL